MSGDRRHWSRRGRPTGNLAFRVETRRGTALQKVYLPRHGGLRDAGRALLVALSRRKTASTPRGRCATEKALLRHWTAQGFDVPRDWSEELHDVAADNVALIEFVKGPDLLSLLADDTLPRAERDRLLVTFAGEWCRRHERVLADRDPRLVQEHGSFEHVLVRDGRFVVFDLEQAYRGRTHLLARVADEIAGYLRSLHKRVPAETFAADVAALVRGYGNTDLLRACSALYSGSASPLGRLFHRLDRWMREHVTRGGRKYEAMDVLARTLPAVTVAAPAVVATARLDAAPPSGST